MYESILSQPYSLFGPFDRLRRELDDVFGSPGLPSSIRSVAPGTVPAINIGRTRADALFSAKLEADCGAALEALVPP
jgi:hypothetical protein